MLLPVLRTAICFCVTANVWDKGWRGSHHHASMSIVSNGVTIESRRHSAANPKDHVPRGSPTRAAPRTGLDHLVAPAREFGVRRLIGFLPSLQLDQPTATFMTQYDYYS